MRIQTLILCATSLLISACTNDAENKQVESAEMLAVNARAADILAKMTLEEKVGQIIQADISAVSPEDVKNYNLGSILNGGNSAPGGGKVASVEAWVKLADEFWAASTDTSDGGVGIAALWGTDAVHGHNNLQSATIFPHNIGLGAANNPELIGQIAAVTAKEIRATGIEWTFAPTLAVAQDDRWGRTYESYSEDPDIVARYSKAMVEGLQGKPSSDGFLKGSHVISTAKHFVADGGTQFGIDKGDTQGNLAEILNIHGAGYAPAIDADVQTVMASFSSVNGIKMHGYRELLNDTLRGDLGFKGFVVGDWNGHGEIPGCTATDCPAALEAGIDMYMAPDSWKGLYTSLLAQAQSGALNLARLDEAVTRILKVKIRSGLLDAPAPSKRIGTIENKLGTAEHRAVARESVRKSLVLLKNTGGLLPIKPKQNILVTGSGADSIQQQTGGWTLNWQGDGNSNSEFEAAETIFAGLSQAMKSEGGSATLSADGSFKVKPDVAVVVFGEQPYAEYRGDRSDLVFEGKDGGNLALLKSFKEQGIPVVAVFLSGRPMWVNPHLNASDAFVAAWLPGTEGGGLADVLVANNDGKAKHDFVGRLSFSWPSLGDGKPLNGKDAEGALFPLGFGLSYSDADTLSELSEDPGIDLASGFDGKIVQRGDAAGALSLYLGDSSNANVPATALVSKSLSGAVSTSGVDYKAQEDARNISFAGSGSAKLSVRAPRPIDLSNKNLNALLIEWRVGALPSGALKIGMTCGEGCGGMIDAKTILQPKKSGEWQTDIISLQCFTAAGMDLSKMAVPFVVEANSKTDIAIHRIEIVQSESISKSCAN